MWPGLVEIGDVLGAGGQIRVALKVNLGAQEAVTIVQFAVIHPEPLRWPIREAGDAAAAKRLGKAKRETAALDLAVHAEVLQPQQLYPAATAAAAAGGRSGVGPDSAGEQARPQLPQDAAAGPTALQTVRVQKRLERHTAAAAQHRIRLRWTQLPVDSPRQLTTVQARALGIEHVHPGHPLRQPRAPNADARRASGLFARHERDHILPKPTHPHAVAERVHATVAYLHRAARPQVTEAAVDAHVTLDAEIEHERKDEAQVAAERDAQLAKTHIRKALLQQRLERVLRLGRRRSGARAAGVMGAVRFARRILARQRDDRPAVHRHGAGENRLTHTAGGDKAARQAAVVAVANAQYRVLHSERQWRW
eukprot:ctg_172.g108